MDELIAQVYGYLHAMWRYRWSALLMAWLAALLGWLIVFSMPDQYNAKAVVYIDTSSVMKPLLKGLALETDAKDELNVMSRVLLSRENLLSVIRETDMDLEIHSPEARERLAEALAGSIVLKGGGSGKKWEPKSNIYEISYQHSSADHVYQVVSKLLNTMIENTLNSSRTDTVMAQKFLVKQIADYEERLTIAEQHLAEFKKANIGFMPDEKGGYYVRLQSALASVENTRSALRLAERRRSELEKQLRGEKSLLGSESYEPASVAKLREYQQQLDELLKQYTEGYPDVQVLRSTIADLKANRDSGEDEAPAAATGEGDTVEFNPVYQELKVEISKASVEVETLKIQLAERQGYVEKFQQSIDVIPEVEAKLAKLNRDYEITRQRYLDLVERRESARLAQDAGQTDSDINFRVIEPPIVPRRPSGPKRLLLLSGVLLAAMGAGLGWSLLRYLLQPTFIDLRQVRSKSGFPVLGPVSLYVSPEHKKKRRLQLVSFLSAAVLLLGVFGGVLWYRDTGTALVVSFITGPNRL
jgi:polysaccharide chain length determinant protein (PEP-CTERM system associated)